MNTDMWEHPVTAKHLETLGAFGYVMVPPVAKLLACGVVGANVNVMGCGGCEFK